MTLQEGIEKLKTLLFSEQKPEAYKFETAKLNDGATIVEWEGDLATGAIVFIVGEAGKLPAPIGVYTLEDGTTFEVVNEQGAIDNVVKAGENNPDKVPDVAPNMEAAPNGTPAPAQAPVSPKRVIKSQVEEHVFKLEIEGIEPIEVDFSSMFKSLNEKFEAVQNENKELTEKLTKANDLNKEIFNVVKQIADEPMTQPTETKKEFNINEWRKAYKADLKRIEQESLKNINQ